jgi:HAMP domain-containing protein
MLKRLKIWQKFTLIAVAFSLPIVVLSYFLILETNKTIDFTRAELDGTQYLRPLRKLAVDVAAHRDLAAAVVAGDASFKPELDKRAEAIEADFKEIAAQDARTAVEFEKTRELEKLRQEWQTVRLNMAGHMDQSYAEQSHFLRRLQQFTVLIGNASNLILDPDVDSYYLVDSLVFKIPKLTTEVSEARAVGFAFCASGGQGEVNAQRKGSLAQAYVKINDALVQENDSLAFARNFNARTEQALGAAASDATKAVNSFTSLLNDKVVNGTGEVMPAKDFHAAASAPLDGAGKLWDAGIVELDRLLAERNAALQKNRMLEIGIVGIALLLTILFLIVVVRAITRPIAHLSEVADRISLGEMDAEINVDTKDEIGELGERFRRLQVSLKAAMDALEKREEDEGG